MPSFWDPFGGLKKGVLAGPDSIWVQIFSFSPDPLLGHGERDKMCGFRDLECSSVMT